MSITDGLVEITDQMTLRFMLESRVENWKEIEAANVGAAHPDSTCVFTQRDQPLEVAGVDVTDVANQTVFVQSQTGLTVEELEAVLGQWRAAQYGWVGPPYALFINPVANAWTVLVFRPQDLQVPVSV